MEEIRRHFPALHSCTYLNTASNGVIPKPVIDWRRQHDLDLMNHASVFRDKHKEHIEQIREKVATFFHSSSSETALIPNLSFGINMVLEALPKGKKILLLQGDYPSISWPVETRGFEICYAQIDENLEANIESAIAKHKPDVFMFSIVQWLTGIKIDFQFLKDIKNNYPNLLLVGDGSQYLGMETFNFAESGIDILGTSGYKWLTAGYGNGFLMIKEQVQQQLYPRTLGFNSALGFDSSPNDTLFIRRFEPGHQDTLNYGSLEQSLLFVEQMGLKKVYSHLKQLSEDAKEQLTALGLLEEHTIHRKEHSSIFKIKGDKELFQKLRNENIISSPRGGGIRISFHYYNTQRDLDHLTNII